LSDKFVSQYTDREVPWGYTDAAGNSVGEITFLRTYSRIKEDGRKETWVDVCRRVIEGMFSIQKDYVKRSEEHTSELQSRENLVCRLLLEKKNTDLGW